MSVLGIYPAENGGAQAEFDDLHRPMHRAPDGAASLSVARHILLGLEAMSQHPTSPQRSRIYNDNMQQQAAHLIESE